MIKKILMASLAVGAIALNAPAAQALTVTADCGFNTVAQEDATGGQDTFTGAAYGYAVNDAGNVSVWCEVRVDGVAADSTDPGQSGPVSVTGGQVTFTATDTQDVDLCAVWDTTGDGVADGSLCSETTTTQIPPQEVIDLLVEITSIPDFVLCPLLASLTPGVPGVVDIDAEGDVSIVGEAFWDCPPYGS